MHQALLSSGSSFFAWVDLAQTSDAYSAADKLRACAVVRNVLGSAPMSLLAYQEGCFWQLHLP